MSYKYAEGTGITLNNRDIIVRITRMTSGTDLDTTFHLGPDGYVLEYVPEDDKHFLPGIMSSQCKVETIWEPSSFTALNNFVTHLAAADDGEFVMEILDESNVMWVGVIMSDQFELLESSEAQTVRLVASDGLGMLKTIKYNNAGTSYTGYKTVFQYLLDIQEKWTLYTRMNELFGGGVQKRMVFADDNVSTDDLLYTTHPPSTQFKQIQRARIHTQVFNKTNDDGVDEYHDCYTMLESFCTTFRWKLYSWEGHWVFVPVGLVNGAVQGWWRKWDGLDAIGPAVSLDLYGFDTPSQKRLKGAGWVRSFSPPVHEVRITRDTSRINSLICVRNGTLNTFYYDGDQVHDGITDVDSSHMYRIDGRLLLDITADATLENWERIGQLVMALNIRWGDNEEWTRNTLSPDISPMNANWDNYGIPGGYSIDYTALNVSGAAPGFSSGYFYIHNNSDPYDRWIYDPGLSQTRYLDFSVYIPVPNVQRTGLSIYPVLQVYDYTGDLSTGLRADIDASLLRLDVYKVVAEAVMELESFDFYARTTTGRDKVHFGTTLIGDFGVGQQMGGIEVLKDGGYGSTESWVSVSQSTPKKINQLAVEEVLAQHVKSKLVERGVLLTRGSWVPSVPYNQFYDSETGTYYHPLSWRMIATPVEHEVTLFKTGRDFENITSDEDNPTRNPFGQFGGGGIDAGTTVGNYGGRGLSAMFGYNNQAAEIFDAWTAGTVIGAGKTLEAYYTVVINGQGKAVNFQGNTPADPNDVIERVIWVKSDGLANHTSTSGWTSPAGLQPTATSSFGPTLQECWEAINAYLSKFNGSQNNFTFLISYEELFFEGLLDDYSGAAAAYSLRRLDSAYTGDPIRVRRASDNTEADIPFTSTGDLDTDALLAHCNNSKGYVKTWYDQSGNANDATQTPTGNQPMIVDTRTNLVNYSEGLSAFSGGATETLASSELNPNESSGTVVEISNFQGASGDRIQSNTVGVNPTATYTGSLYVKGTSGQTIKYYIKRVNTSATYVGSSQILHTFDGSWQRVEATFTTLSDTIDCAFHLRNDAATTADTFYVWGAQIEQNDTATDYILSNGSPGSVGFLVTENGRPAMQFDGSNDGLPYDNTGLDIGDLSSFVVGKYDSTANQQMMLGLSGSASNQRWYAPYLNGGDFNYGYASTFNAMTATANLNQNLHTMIAGTTLGSAEAFLNSTSLGTATLSSGINATDGIMNLNNAFYANGKVQEVIVYDSDQSSNRTGIEDNINDYYDIY
jgi:hypothetical protein